MTTSDMKQTILRELEDKYGDRLLDLGQCTDIYNSLLEHKALIEARLNPSNCENLIGAALQEAKQIVGESVEITSQSKKSIEVIEKELREIDQVNSDLKARVDKLNTYQTTLQYLKVVQQIEYLCSELQHEVSKKDDEKCVTLFANITEIYRILSDCPLLHLKDFLKETMLYWHNILRDKLGKVFDEALKQVKWPFLSANFSLVSPFEVNVDKLQLLAEYLLQIEIPPEANVPPSIPLGVLSDFIPPCLPIQLLILPLRKRFIYHFYGNRKTNRVDRPEWYFTQILTWIKDHQDYMGTWIQPVIDKFGLHHIDAKNEFMRGLVQLAAEKLNSEISSIQFDDFAFSHSIDEALGFDKELRELYNYPASEPSIIGILTQAQVLVKWLSMEKKYATEKMDAILSSSSMDAFDLLTSDVEDLKITTCADAFITLLQTIAERYECLPQPGHRLQFLELQLELLDDFRVRLLQIVNAEEGDYMESKIPSVANTLYYVENVLVDWGTMLHYLNLYYYKNQINDAEYDAILVSPNLSDFDDHINMDLESDTLFAETLSLYRHFRRDLLAGLAEAVLMEVRKRSWNYRRERWAFMKVGKEFRSLSLTPSACPMFEVLSKRLHQLQKKLQSKLFIAVFRNIATQLDTHLFEDLVLDNRFNDGGALQFKFDITRNLLPLFAHYTDMPATYFPQLSESYVLLNLAKGSALLLRETLLALDGTTGVEDTRGKMLKEIGVNNFSPKMAIKILNQRVDITINRVNVD
uniref:RAD50-interacting protein 1 n=1 Tax=Dendroctonus ponderosae TaxID=77166 RepID=A0AAR5NYY9_DENPD